MLGFDSFSMMNCVGVLEGQKVRVIRCRMALVTTHTYLVSELHREI